jgi:hypothetical protein
MAVKLINTGGAVKLTVPNTDALKDEIKGLQGEVAELNEDIAELNTEITGLNENIAELEKEVGEAFEEGKAEGIEEGKEAEVKAFWDSANGSFNVDGKYHFAGSLWNDYTFNPTQSYTFNNCQGTFQDCRIKDLKGILERNNVTFNFSKARYFDYMAYSSTIESFPLIDTNGATRLYWTFAYMTGQNISMKLIIKDDGSLDFSNAFSNTNIKELIIVSGVIGKNGLNLQWSISLNKASIESIINALSATTTGLTVTLSQTAIDNAFTAEEWETLRNTKKNWTITLI